MRLYYVVFTGKQRIRWWHIFTGLKYTHIILLTYSTKKSSLMISLEEGGLEINTYNCHVKKLADDFRKSNEVYTYIAKQERKISITFLVTCVSLAKVLLGIRQPFIITPKQLRKYLIKKEAEC